MRLLIKILKVVLNKIYHKIKVWKVHTKISNLNYPVYLEIFLKIQMNKVLRLRKDMLIKVYKRYKNKINKLFKIIRN